MQNYVNIVANSKECLEFLRTLLVQNFKETLKSVSRSKGRSAINQLPVYAVTPKDGKDF